MRLGSTRVRHEGRCFVGGRASKQKGYRREREVVLALREVGLDANRTPLSGALGGELAGDVLVKDPGRSSVERIEVKGRKELPKVLEGWLGENDALVLIADRQPWRVYIPFASYLEFLQQRKREREL